MSRIGPTTSRGLPSAGNRCNRQVGLVVDLADRASGVDVRAADVGGQEVHAGDVEPDGERSSHGHRPVVGMDLVGDVHGHPAQRHVGDVAQVDRLAGTRHAAAIEPAPREHPVGAVVERE
jgi:hypothetical protein